ncbi:MAG: UDP-glucose--hexose-1-phosphate uridylyltransferase [Gammaproteobacteria bacterium]|nr:UDP-glucose--hexose-1-phosphate uridylyltransferase [Gammaproteobacteria bacterium]
MTVQAPRGLHRRRNPLTGRWVLVSAQRNARPWQGEIAKDNARQLPDYDPGCYLCPGNRRATGEINPRYDGVYVFDNDFPALGPAVADDTQGLQGSALLTFEAVQGHCRVVCYSPDHGRGLSRLSGAHLRAVVDTWASESARLGQSHRWVQVFENKGAMMGCSNPHPHGQIWASDHLPDEAVLEEQHQRAYFATHGEALLASVAREEFEGLRHVWANSHWLVIVPWWATWPFETLVLPRQAAPRLESLDHAARDALAETLHQLTRRYDLLFDCEFPYSMGWHGAPYTQQDPRPWQIHAHFYPPLLRSATVRKFMVGYEMLAEAQRDLSAEDAARRLRELSVST